MFKDVPSGTPRSSDDPVEFLLAELDRHNIQQAIVTRTTARPSARCASTPTGSSRASASTRTRAWRRCARSTRSPTSSTSSACGAFPAGLYPQVAINDKKFFPIYMKCVELDIPFASTMGVPGPRIPFAPQDVAHLDEICWFFPELQVRDAPRLRAVGRPRGEAHAQVAEPLLLDHRVRAEVLPEGHHRLREHPRRRQDDLVRLLPRRAHLRPDLRRAARRPVPRPRLAEVPARERAAACSSCRTTLEASRGRSPGIRVIELPNIGPTQFAGMALGDLGAEVLRLDRATASRPARAGRCPRRRTRASTATGAASAST